MGLQLAILAMPHLQLRWEKYAQAMTIKAAEL